MKGLKVLFVGVVIAAAILSACAPASTPATAPVVVQTEAPDSAPTSGATQGVDPQNATYLIDGKEVTLVNGVAEQEAAPGSATGDRARATAIR